MSVLPVEMQIIARLHLGGTPLGSLHWKNLLFSFPVPVSESIFTSTLTSNDDVSFCNFCSQAQQVALLIEHSRVFSSAQWQCTEAVFFLFF